MKKWTETVKRWPEVRELRAYRVRITEIEKMLPSKSLKVTFEFLEKPQLGRRLPVHLALPIRETSMTADFFNACGLAVTPSSKIAPCEVLGVVIQICFQREPQSNEWQPKSFQPVKEDHNHGNSESQHQPR